MHTPSTGPSSPEIGRLSLISSQDSQTSLTSVVRRTEDTGVILAAKSIPLTRSRSALGLNLCTIMTELETKITKLRDEKRFFIEKKSLQYQGHIDNYRGHIAEREPKITTLEADLVPLTKQSDELGAQLIRYDQLITQAKAAHMATEDLMQRAQAISEQYKVVQTKIVKKTTRLLQYRDDIITFKTAITANEKKIDKIAQQANNKFDIHIESLTDMVSKYTHHH